MYVYSLYFLQRKRVSVRIIFSVAIAGAVLLLSGCRGTRFIPEGKYLYTGAKVKYETKGSIPRKAKLDEEVQAAIRPKPNKVYLGMRPGVWFYYIAGQPKKKKGLRTFIKTKLGREPILLDKANPDRTSQLLTGVLKNNGYFEATVKSEVEKKKKTASVTYTATLVNPPYRIRNLYYQALDTVYGPISYRIRQESLLKKGRIYRLTALSNELKRVATVVRDSGFYFFDDSYLIFHADSTIGTREVDLYLRFEKKIPLQAKKIYTLDTVEVINHYSLAKDSSELHYRSMSLEGYRYFYRRDDIRPKIVLSAINLKTGHLYRRSEQELTLNRLTNLGVFKFVNIRFEPTDSNRLKAKIYLTPLLIRSLRLEAQATSKSNSFVGPALSVTYISRNFLKGAELFQTRVNTAYEVQIGGVQKPPINSFEFGAETSLTIPRFISPIYLPYSSHQYVPQTIVKVGFRLQKRVGFFRLNSFNLGYGYAWRESAWKTHELYPIDITFFQLGNISDAFAQQLAINPILQRSYQNQFILGARYSYTYNTHSVEQAEKQRDNLFFNGNIDISGNLAYLAQRTTNSSRSKTDNSYQVFGEPYSQFTRLDVDVRYYHTFKKDQQLATRLIVGAGYAYGNSITMPYVKQFSAGGSNSLRAFRARSVGPGSYARPDSVSTFFVDQTGDAKIESSTEYRFGIFGYLKGAVFIDAGNIWLLGKDPLRPGSDFVWNTFLKEVAVGTGFGLRLDANFFVFRLDLAFPLRKPSLPESERWVIRNIDFGSRNWRKNNLILNVGIGYPF